MRQVYSFIFLCFVTLSISTSFDFNTGYYFWNFAAMTDQDIDQIRNLTCPSCEYFKGRLSDVNLIQNKETEIRGLIGIYENRTILIGFRGSKDLKNWITDLQSVVLTDFSIIDSSYNARVGNGFYNAYLSVRDQVFSYVKDYSSKYSFPYTFVGHSMGASLVKICATDLYHNANITIDTMYTFGAPYTGNKDFANHFNLIIPNHYRMTHNCDPVPHLPPKGFLLAHTGDEVFLNEQNTNYGYCEKPEKLFQCANACLFPTNFNDHVTYFNNTNNIMNMYKL